MGNSILDEIREKASLTDVVLKFGHAKFQHTSYTAPFRGIHGTHSSSSDTHLEVDPVKGFWRCYSCNQGGSVIDWVLSVEFENNRACLNDAAALIAKELEIQYDDIVLDGPQYQAYQTLTKFAFYAHANLLQNGHVLDFVRTTWGLSDEAIDKLCIGYSEDGLCPDADHTDMLSAGLYRGDGQALLRNRIVFPYYQGAQCRWLTGRYVGAPPEGIPKYQALQSTPYVSPLLFNFDNALSVRKEEPLIITEGPADACAAFTHGLRCVAVNSHTLRPEDLEDLLKLCKASTTVYIIMDSEESQAGFKGAKRTAQMLVNSGVDPFIVDLPRKDQTHVDLCEFLKVYRSADLKLIITGEWGEDATRARTLADIVIAECPVRPQGAQYLDILKTFAMLPDVENSRYMAELQKRTGAKESLLKAMVKDVRKEFNRERERLQLVEDYEEVPFLAQDFTRDPVTGVWQGHICVYAPYSKTSFKELDEYREVVMTPIHVITSMYPGGEWAITDKRPLHHPSSRIEAMIPMESVLNFPASGRYAWSFKTANPWSLTNFIMGKSPTLEIGALYDAILDLFNTYVVYPDSRDAHVLTLFTFFTYIFMGFSVTPYIHCHGPKASGKSTTLGILSNLCFNAIASSSISVAAANRLIHVNRPTLIMDEAEKLKSPKPGTAEMEILSMALAGNAKVAMSQAFRCATLEQIRPVSFWTYCPKVFGAIAEMQRTLASRIISIQCRALRKEDRGMVKDFSKDEIYLSDQFQSIRDQLHVFGVTMFREVREQFDLLDGTVFPGLESRTRQMWLPLLAIAKVVEEKSGRELANLFEDVIAKKADVSRIEDMHMDFMLACTNALYRVIMTENPVSLFRDSKNGRLICSPEAARLVKDRLRDDGDWLEHKNQLQTGQMNRFLRDAGAIPAGVQPKSYSVPGMYGGKQQAHFPFDLAQLRYFLESKGLNVDYDEEAMENATNP